MKRSEMEAILSAGRGGVNWPGEICDEMEARGHTWDPEDAPLPERLESGWGDGVGGRRYRVFTAHGPKPWIFEVAKPATETFPDGWRERVACEVVRRYNREGALRKLVAQMKDAHSNAWAVRLEEALDGREQ